ncbi:MAG TPA: menaquinone biosynthesis decarboxylase, partial [Chthoniobacterales bacterium]
MAYASFRDFLETLERAGELKRIAEPVDTELVISEWADREMKSAGGGKALLFEQPVIDGKTSKFPVAINTMGSRKRMAMALGRDSIDDVAQEIQLILKAKPPTDLREGFALLKQGIHLLHARPKLVRDGACQEIVHKIENGGSDLSLRDLPI